MALALTLLVIYTTLGVARDIVNWLRPAGHLGFSANVAMTAAALIALAVALRHSTRPLGTLLALAMCAVPYLAAISLMDRAEERMHLIQYGLVGLLAYASFPHANRARRYAQAVLFVLAAGWIDELIQAILPSRMYDLRDVAFNFTAGVLSLISLAVFQQLGGQREPRRSE